MKKLFTSALIAAALTSSAFAQVETVFEHGVWELSAGRTNNGTAVCILGTGGTDDGVFWNVSIKRFAGNADSQIWVSQASWKIPADVETVVKIEFDNMGSWSVDASGHDESPDGSILWGVLSAQQTNAFLDELMVADFAVITFAGTERPWRISMDGSAATLAKYKECTDILGNAPSQPFDATPQPFDSSPAPAASSQPFVPA